MVESRKKEERRKWSVKINDVNVDNSYENNSVAMYIETRLPVSNNARSSCWSQNLKSECPCMSERASRRLCRSLSPPHRPPPSLDAPRAPVWIQYCLSWYADSPSHNGYW